MGKFIHVVGYHTGELAEEYDCFIATDSIETVSSTIGDYQRTHIRTHHTSFITTDSVQDVMDKIFKEENNAQ